MTADCGLNLHWDSSQITEGNQAEFLNVTPFHFTILMSFISKRLSTRWSIFGVIILALMYNFLIEFSSKIFYNPEAAGFDTKILEWKSIVLTMLLLKRSRRGGAAASAVRRPELASSQWACAPSLQTKCLRTSKLEKFAFYDTNSVIS